MTCNQIAENIPGLIRRELSGYERIPLLSHLQNCPDCQSEYRQYLKMYYTIDLEIVSKPAFTFPVDASLGTDQGPKITAPSPHLFKKRTFYAAAALIIFSIISIGYFIRVQAPDRKLLPVSVESVQNNDSQPTSVPLNIGPKIDALLTTDKISLNYIENQLLQLHKKGVDNFIFHQSSLPVAESTAEIFAPLYNKNVPVNDCLEKVQSIKKYKSYLTISELVSFLTILEKQGA